MTLVRNKVRAGVFPFEIPSASAALPAAAAYSQRQNFILPFTPLRWRVHIQNINGITDASPGAGTVTGFTMYVGTPTYGTDGIWNGGLTAVPTSIQASTSIVNGTELVTAWQAPSVGNIVAGAERTLSYQFVTPASAGNMAFGGAGNWQCYQGSIAAQQAATNYGYSPNASFFFIWIEYEFADDLAPVIVVPGSSLCCGGNNANVTNRGVLGSWPQQWALANKGVAASLAIAGSNATHFAAGNNRWSRFATTNQPLDVDAVVYFQPVSSDIISGGTGTAAVIAQVKTNYVNMITRGKALYPNAQHIVTNIAPRVEFTGDGTAVDTLEYARLQINEWLSQLPMGVSYCQDVDSLLSDRANPARLKAEFSADGTHMRQRGHQLVAATTPIGRG